jgi:hypothetical protein
MANNRLLVIIFSFNRALQLDCLLRTTLKYLDMVDFSIKIIFDTTGNHSQGYLKLKKKYKEIQQIEFIEIELVNNFWSDKFPLLFKNRNLWRYIKHPYLRTSLDNFKKLLELQIINSECEFTMFLTDDGYFFQNVVIPTNIFEKIRHNPMQISYRMYVGRNLENCPPNLEKTDNLLKWNYYDPKLYSHWAYPFSVDATVYHSSTLLKIIKPVFYHMPTTLESFVVTHCRSRKLLSIGYSPLESNYVGLNINRVSVLSNNYAGNINPQMLNARFIEGYVLDYEFPTPPRVQTIIPNKILLAHSTIGKIIIEPLLDGSN